MQFLAIKESFNWRNCKKTCLALCLERTVDFSFAVADGDMDSTLRNPATKAPLPAPPAESDWTDPVDSVSLMVRSGAAAWFVVRPAARENLFNRLFLKRLRYQHQFCVPPNSSRVLLIFCSCCVASSQGPAVRPGLSRGITCYDSPCLDDSHRPEVA
ncbi:hypothetical protein RvY_11032 [Ramazzottius varieornatus]|uniref:Uncharacterized protein n=1 Tax=Ramazzottius varieornatus TaxID=947166 RepID=A0A1D1VET8_RAMVA|nr:hypothetical protein RvY_11032 [Ramazzottius varieornatus]